MSPCKKFIDHRVEATTKKQNPPRRHGDAEKIKTFLPLIFAEQR